MNEHLFAELMASVEEAGRIARGEAAPSRAFNVEREPLDVAGIREGYKLSQTRFAALLGISVKTLRNWEQGRRSPEARRVFCCKWQPNTLMSCGMSCVPNRSDMRGACSMPNERDDVPPPDHLYASGLHYDLMCPDMADLPFWLAQAR